jgi:hypothetical protein
MKTLTSRPPAVEDAVVTRYRSMVVRELMQHMSTEELEEIRLLPKEQTIVLHHSLGAAIRCEYELWMPEHEVSAFWVAANKQFPLEPGQIDEHACHPDNFSMSCIDALWEELQ